MLDLYWETLGTLGVVDLEFGVIEAPFEPNMNQCWQVKVQFIR
jgi:hypothetical protein